MALSKPKIAPRRTLAAMKAAVNVETAMVAATIAAVNALKARARTLKEMARSIPKLRRRLQPQRQRHCWMQTVMRLQWSKPVNKVKSNVSPESAVAVTVMAATAVNVVTTLNATMQAQRPRAAQPPLIQNPNRLWGSKNRRKMLLNL